MPGRVFECLQQRVRGALRQHVDLVEDVHLAPAGRAERRPFVQLADAVDAVVRSRVELEHVEGRAVLDRPTHLAGAARLAVGHVRAVEGLGEDARRRGLAGASRAAEQVGVRDAVLPNGVAKGPHHMVLPEHLVEPLGAIPAIQRLVTLHSADTTGRLADGRPGYPWARARHVRWRPGPVQRQPVNRVRAGRQQLSADTAVCRRSPGRRREMAGASRSPVSRVGVSGGMRERTNRHAWRACVGQPTVGSNPTPSAPAPPVVSPHSHGAERATAGDRSGRDRHGPGWRTEQLRPVRPRLARRRGAVRRTA